MHLEATDEYTGRLEKKCDVQATALAKCEHEIALFRELMSILALPSDPVESTITWLHIFVQDVSSALGFHNWRELLNQAKLDRALIPAFKTQVCSLFKLNPRAPDQQLIDELAKSRGSPNEARDDFATTLAVLLEMDSANSSEILQRILELQRLASGRSQIEKDLTKALKVSSVSEILPTVEDQVSFVNSLQEMLNEQPSDIPRDDTKRELNELRIVTAESAAILNDLCELFEIVDPRELPESVTDLQRELKDAKRDFAAQKAKLTAQSDPVVRLPTTNEDFQTRFQSLWALTGADWRDGIAGALEKVEREVRDLCDSCDAPGLSDCRERLTSVVEPAMSTAHSCRSGVPVSSDQQLCQKQLRKVFKEMSRVFGVKLRRLSDMKAITASAVHWRDHLTRLCNEFHLEPSAHAVSAFFADAHETRRNLNDFFGRVDKWLRLGEFTLKGVEIAVQHLSEDQEQFLALGRFANPRGLNPEMAVESIRGEMERLQEICCVLKVESSLSALAEIRKFREANGRAESERLKTQVHSLHTQLMEQHKAVDAVLHQLRVEFGHQEIALRDAMTAFESLSLTPDTAALVSLDPEPIQKNQQRRHSCASAPISSSPEPRLRTAESGETVS
jgi:hypothetical protein